jgi:PilZ domain
MVENRKEPRQKSFLRGKIYFNNRNSTVDCLVRDISKNGARLIFEDEVTIPDMVDLYIAQKDQTLRSHIVWRRDTEAGICFAIPEQAMPAADASDLAARVAKLEQEIELLKRALKRMKSDTTAASDFEAA